MTVAWQHWEMRIMIFWRHFALHRDTDLEKLRNKVKVALLCIHPDICCQVDVAWLPCILLLTATLEKQCRVKLPLGCAVQGSLPPCQVVSITRLLDTSAGSRELLSPFFVGFIAAWWTDTALAIAMHRKTSVFTPTLTQITWKHFLSSSNLYHIFRQRRNKGGTIEQSAMI